MVHSKNEIHLSIPRFLPFNFLIIRIIISATSFFFVCIIDNYASQSFHPKYPDPLLEAWRWISFPELEGMGIQCMTEASDGTIWFGTETGAIIHYNGLDTVKYYLESPVSSMLMTRAGVLYAGTEKGIFKFDKRNWREVCPMKLDYNWTISGMVESNQGVVLAGSKYGLLSIRDDEISIYTARDQVDAIKTFAPSVKIFVVPDHATTQHAWSRGFGVFTRAEVIYALAPDGPAKQAGLSVGDSIIAINDKQDLFINLFNNDTDSSVHLKVRSHKNSRVFDVTLKNEYIPDVLHELLVYNLFKDSKGGLWFSQDFGNITYFETVRTDREIWKIYSLTSGINPNVKNTYQFAQTADGDIWASLSQPQSHLNRFDGNQWTGFPVSQIGGIMNMVTSMLAASNGSLWLGGWGILYIYQNKNWKIYKPEEIPILDSRIISIFETSDHKIWLITKGSKVLRFDNSMNNWTMLEDLNFQGEATDGTQWFIAADGRVVSYDKKQWLSFGVEDGLMSDPVCLLITKKDEVWAGGSQDHVAATAIFTNGKWNMMQHPTLSWGIDYRAILEDDDQGLWFGAAVDFEQNKQQMGGVLHVKDFQFNQITSVLSSNFMAPYGIAQTRDGEIWFGGIYGLFRFNNGNIKKVIDPIQLAQPSIDALYASAEGELWVGTRYFGIFHYNPASAKWRAFTIDQGLSSNKIIGITQTRDGTIWAATNLGYDCFDGKMWTQSALPATWHLSQDGGSINSSADSAIWINQTSKAWNRRAWPNTPPVAEYEFRTLRYKPDSQSPQTVISETEKEIAQPGNVIFSWHAKDPWNVTPQEKLEFSWRLDDADWSQFFTTTNQVFFKLPAGKHTFQVKARDTDLNEDETPASVLFKVLPPIWQQPWFVGLLSVLIAIIFYQTVRVIRRDQRLRVTNKSLAKERSIEHIRAVSMAVGTVHDISNVLTELTRELNSIGHKFHYIGISLVDEAIGILHHYEMASDNAAPQYTELPLDTISENYLTRWKSGQIISQKINGNNITELLPIQAQSSQPQEVLGSGSMLLICFEYGTFALATENKDKFLPHEVETIRNFCDVILAGYAKYLNLRKIERQQAELMRVQLAGIQERLENELRLERIEKEQERQVYLLKQQFFTDISHEFRTPLTLIISPLQKIISKIDQNHWLTAQIAIIHKNAERLLRLVNQLLDFRKLDEGCLKLELFQGDLIQFIKNIFESFQPSAEKKQIELDFHSNYENLLTWFDPDKIDKIIYNLLCNALKFTQDNGKVTLSITVADYFTADSNDGYNIGIKVEDNGMGIGPEDILYVFDRFYQSKNQPDCDQKGSGIGLALTKELVELHGGTISVHSEAGKGACFVVQLPMRRTAQMPGGDVPSHFEKTPPAETESSEHGRGTLTGIEKEIRQTDMPRADVHPDDQTKFKILIVEDNDDIRSYIRDDLSEDYDIAEASNGIEGLETARKIIPDLIISDIIMPGMDGNTLCQQLKTDERTSHIPVILLTARSSEEDKTHGLIIGADDYIVKPFNVNELKARVHNLIKSRQQLRERFSRDIKLEPRNIYISSIDEKFLQRVIKTIEENIHDSDFGVESLSQAVRMNRVQLYRKIKSLTNQTVNDFIRILRLKRAAQLLEQSNLTVTEIAYEVGFSDSSNFARDFRKHFGKPPSAYIQKKNKNR
ncbi:MAG: response regulator [Candidatus Zhuqueibacterota bacterium]